MASEWVNLSEAPLEECERSYVHQKSKRQDVGSLSFSRRSSPREDGLREFSSGTGTECESLMKFLSFFLSLTYLFLFSYCFLSSRPPPPPFFLVVGMSGTQQGLSLDEMSCTHSVYSLLSFALWNIQGFLAFFIF